MHAVEGVGDVDDALLLADRRDGVGERHSTRDLLVQEEPDDLAVAIGLDLLAGDHDEVVAARGLDRLERPREDVVVGHRDRAEALSLRMGDERRGLDRAVVRVVRVHVEVDDDPVAVGEGLGLVASGRSAASPGLRVVALDELCDDTEILALDPLPSRGGVALARHRILGQTEQRRGRELRLAREAGWLDDRAPRGGRLGAQPAEPVGRRHDDRGVLEHLGARVAGERGAHVDAVAQRERDRRAGGQPARPQQDRLPAVDRPQGAEHGANDGQAAGRALDHDALLLGERFEEVEVDTGGDDRELARESLAARAAVSSPTASSVSIRARSLSRWLRRGGWLSRSGSTKVATVVVSASRRAT